MAKKYNTRLTAIDYEIAYKSALNTIDGVELAIRDRTKEMVEHNIKDLPKEVEKFIPFLKTIHLVEIDECISVMKEIEEYNASKEPFKQGKLFNEHTEQMKKRT